jgi:hypothetical protein
MVVAYTSKTSAERPLAELPRYSPVAVRVSHPLTHILPSSTPVKSCTCQHQAGTESSLAVLLIGAMQSSESLTLAASRCCYSKGKFIALNAFCPSNSAKHSISTRTFFLSSRKATFRPGEVEVGVKSCEHKEIPRLLLRRYGCKFADREFTSLLARRATGMPA